MSLLIPVAIIAAASLVTLSAISMHLFYLQLAYIAAGAAIVALLAYKDWMPIIRARWFVWGLYLLTVALLIFTFLRAPVIRNTRSWIVFGPVEFQPVELAKVALILAFASFLSRRHIAMGRLRNVLWTFLIFAVPAGLTFLQPDLGSASILFGIWFGLVLISGLPRRFLIFGAVIMAVSALIGWHWFLKPYQKERISGIFYPEKNALTYNYQVNQSKIAVGSAGIFGKGYRQGTQTQLGFLTEASTDFVFASFTEEWGLFGALIVLVSFLMLILAVLKTGLMQQSNFEHFMVLGIAMLFGLQFLVNSGSATGIFPVIGVTFPFFSYGGSSFLINSGLLGLVYSARKRA